MTLVRRSRSPGSGSRGRVLCRLPGPSGAIRVLEEPVTGVRLYEEGGVAQSRVRAGGDSDVAYVRLMSVLLQGSREVLLLGCGGGSLAGMLHRRGSSVTVVDVNPVSFELARTFFWMPPDVSCVSGDARDFLAAPGRTFDAIGVDVGGPRFSYTAVLSPVTVGDACRALRTGGRIAVNISLEAPDDPVPGRIADRFAAEGLAVWVLSEPPHSNEVNAVIVASRRPERPSDLASLAGEGWSLARLGEGRNRQLTRGGAQRSVEADA